jgi:DNA-binding response OmpR family regulator
MRKAKLLLADNDSHFLGTLGEYLEAHKVNVHYASSVDEARRSLEDDWFDVAVLDIRLVDDSDDKDHSGLDLARGVAPGIPKLILTSFPSWQAVRDSLGQGRDGEPAVAFLAKEEGVDAVARAVLDVLAKRRSVGSEVILEWGYIDCSAILLAIEPNVAPAKMDGRNAEIEHLFRHAFSSASHIRIVRFLWKRRGCLAVHVFASGSKYTSPSFVVVCRSQNYMSGREVGHRDPGSVSRPLGSLQLAHSEETTHISMEVFICPGADLEFARPLEELYFEGAEKQFKDALRSLYQDRLSAWHRDTGVVEERKNICQVLAVSYPAVIERIAVGAFHRIVTSLARQLPSIGVRIGVNGDALAIQFDQHKAIYPNPAIVLERIFQKSASLLFGRCLGIIAGDSVLIDRNNGVWITELTTHAYAPLIETYSTMEALIRYDWCGETDIRGIHEFELSLTFGEFGTISPGDVEGSLRRAIRCVQEVRRLSGVAHGGDYFGYYVAMLFCALQRVPLCKENTEFTRKELWRAAHALISSLVLAKRVTQGDLTITQDDESALRRLVVDHVQGIVRIGGRSVSLHGQSLELLRTLADAKGELCSRRTLIETVLGVVFDEANESQVSRLNTAIRRLREKIEHDPEHPRYILTELGGGYRLAISRAEEHRSA